MNKETIIRTRNDRTLTVVALVHRGDNFEIAKATSEADAPATLAVRSLRVDPAWSPTVRNTIAELRESEAEAASLLFDADAGIQSVASSDDNTTLDDVLVTHPFVEGTTLQRYVHAEHTDGMPLDLALDFAAQIARQLATLHEARLVHRSPSPEHVIIHDGKATLIGFGNVCKRQQRPAPWQLGGDERYVAPEVLRERSGNFIHPRADVYTFGATLSYMLTGIHPTTAPEAPIDNEAWRRLMTTPEGARLLIAHCMQPLHKNRMVNASKLLPLLSEDSLPDRRTTGFGAIALLAPWTGALEGKSSGLSAGPLTTRAAQAGQREDEAAEDPATGENTAGSENEPASSGAEASDSAERAIIETQGVNKTRLLIGFGLIALVVLGGAFLRLCS